MFRFPKITSTSCSPGFIETDLTRGFATRSGKTPQEMGMLTVEMVSMKMWVLLNLLNEELILLSENLPGCKVPRVPDDRRSRLAAQLHQRMVLRIRLSAQPSSQVGASQLRQFFKIKSHQVQKPRHSCLWRGVSINLNQRILTSGQPLRCQRLSQTIKLQSSANKIFQIG